MNYKLLYFASLSDQAGCTEEIVSSVCRDVTRLYTELRARHGFMWAAENLRVAVNGEFSSWDHKLAEGDEIVFLPPVSGG